MPGPPNFHNRSQQQPSTKKRKREGREERLERLRSYGIDLPDIAGMPVQLIPIHVNALQVTTKFYKEDEGALQGPIVPAEFKVGANATGPVPVAGGALEMTTRSPATGTTSSAVLEGILHRMDAPSAAARAGAMSTNSQHQQQVQRSRSKDAAVADWLQAVHRHLKDNNDRSRRRMNASGADGNDPPHSSSAATAEGPPAVPVRTVVMATFGHLWEQAMQHKRISVRRAALYLSAQLLYRSAECRQFLFESSSSPLPTTSTEGQEPSARSSSSAATTTVLMDWMDRMLDVASPSSSANDRTARQAQHLQQEAYLLLQQLSAKGYGDLYPTLVTALLRFRQIHGNLLGTTRFEELRLAGSESGVGAETATGLRDAAALRLARDQALKHWEKEEATIHKLLRRAGTCMDVLVPRFGFEPPARRSVGEGVATLKGDDNNDKDDDDDDDDSVDWEDGGADADEGSGDAIPASAIRVSAEASVDAHEKAVERTLAAMEATGGLKAGEIEVSFEDQLSSGADDLLPTNAPTTESLAFDSEKARAKAKLESIVVRLAKRHLPRLVAWTEGLVQADGLVESSNPNSRALVSMPSSLASQRKRVLDRLIQLRGSVASVLGSAKRLGIEAEHRPRSDEEPPRGASGRGGGRNTSRSLGVAARPGGAARLATALGQRRTGARRASAVDATRGRSNRIQVKYRSA